MAAETETKKTLTRKQAYALAGGLAAAALAGPLGIAAHTLVSAAALISVGVVGHSVYSQNASQPRNLPVLVAKMLRDTKDYLQEDLGTLKKNLGIALSALQCYGEKAAVVGGVVKAKVSEVKTEVTSRLAEREAASSFAKAAKPAAPANNNQKKPDCQSNCRCSL